MRCKNLLPLLQPTTRRGSELGISAWGSAVNTSSTLYLGQTLPTFTHQALTLLGRDTGAGLPLGGGAGRQPHSGCTYLVLPVLGPSFPLCEVGVGWVSRGGSVHRWQPSLSLQAWSLPLNEIVKTQTINSSMLG